ncbi:integrase catalytic domain-containing protein [Trichonephila clavipes]|nr:integrase catalytic domain-containing protein [Trichonephila clavipes]
MFQTLDKETAAHINIKQSGGWLRPLQLGKEWDLYISLLVDSVFGYIVGGSVKDELNPYSCVLMCGSEELNSSLKKFWEIEEIDNELPKNLENSICEEHYAHKRIRGMSLRNILFLCPLKSIGRV